MVSPDRKLARVGNRSPTPKPLLTPETAGRLAPPGVTEPLRVFCATAAATDAALAGLGKEGAFSTVTEAVAGVFPLPKTVGAVAASTVGVKLGAAGVLETDSSSKADSVSDATAGFPVGGPLPITKCCDEIMD